MLEMFCSHQVIPGPAQSWGTRLAGALLAEQLEATEEGQWAEKGFAEVPVSSHVR